jgi:hypothetical protein
MKVQRKVSATTIVEVDGDSVADVFEALACLENIFAGHETCGLCQKTGVRYECQQDKEGNKYYKAVCVACGAEFRFGVRRQDGQLFPQLKDKDGNFKPNGGWAKWVQNQQQAPPPRQQPQKQQYSGNDVPF